MHPSLQRRIRPSLSLCGAAASGHSAKLDSDVYVCVCVRACALCQLQGFLNYVSLPRFKLQKESSWKCGLHETHKSITYLASI
jgi:hypothetical protein